MSAHKVSNNVLFSFLCLFVVEKSSRSADQSFLNFNAKCLSLSLLYFALIPDVLNDR